MGKEVYMADISGKCDQQTYGKMDQMVTTSSKLAKFPTSTFDGSTKALMITKQEQQW